METSETVIIGGNLSKIVKIRVLADFYVDGGIALEGEIWEMSRVDAFGLIDAGQAERIFSEGYPAELRLPGLHVLTASKFDAKARRISAAPPGSRKPKPRVVDLSGLLIGHVLSSGGRF